MFQFAPLTEEDKVRIASFPSYPEPFVVLDYALRKPTGWLYTIYEKNERAKAYSIFYGRERILIGFTLLDIKDNNEAEVYLALHKDFFAKGTLTFNICKKGLKVAFLDIGLQRLYLSLRLSHEVGYKLYSYLGFRETGFQEKVYNGQTSTFRMMELTRDEYLARYKE